MHKISIVWLKRDLRLSDHEPLSEAIQRGFPVLIVFCFEPSLVAAPQSDDRHWRFVWESLEDLNFRLKNHQASIAIFHSEVKEVFLRLIDEFQIQSVYSHQETGTKITYDRDLDMGLFFKENRIEWKEYLQQGVQRGRKNRERWRNSWFSFANAPLKNPELKRANFISLPRRFWDSFPEKEIPEIWKTANPQMQPGGESKGRMYLKSFLDDRVKNYNRHISKPELARKGCSRLSPYIAWGCLSIREVYQLSEAKSANGFQVRNFANFQSRLRWHCHFIQKFEMESRMEFEPINRGFFKFECPKRKDWIHVWEIGQTGFPLVDACMRCLKETGYLNFRMRAMVVSFLTHHLSQDWRTGKDHLQGSFWTLSRASIIPKCKCKPESQGSIPSEFIIQ